jgi:NAD(P)-dependent dehydrogenase (short-subunit alcohol dehydrogenase family)
MLNTTTGELVLGIVGTGLMGRGIAQISAQAGIDVWLFDARSGAAEEARAAVATTLGTLAAKGKLDTAAVAAAVARLHVADALKDLAGCRVVVEAIVEDLDAKRDLFRQLEDVVADDCILATNTSSLPVTNIAAACRLPGRVGGFHFFSPVPLMKVVEVIDSVVGEAVGRRRADRPRPPHRPPSRCAPATRRASSSITPAAATSPNPCAFSARASPGPPTWTASCAAPAFAWARANCST